MTRIRAHASSASDPHTRLSEAHTFLANGPYTHIILSDVVDIEYLCGFRSTNAFCILSPKKNILLSDFRYREAAIAFCRRSRLWEFSEIRENDFSFCRSSIPHGSVVGYQSSSLTVDEFGQLRQALQKVRFVKLTAAFAEILVPKTDSELLFMKQAASIGDRAFSEALRHLHFGMTEKEVALLLEDRCRNFGSERPSFDTIVLFGRRAALPHGRPSEEVRLERGNWVLCDFGCTVNGFCSDMTRTFVAGKAATRQKKIYNLVLRAQESGKAEVKAGTKASVVDKACRKVISKAGYGKLFGHATGHGVGLRIHEKPRISKNDNTILRKGTVITIEPGIYSPEFGGVRIEDMVVVRDTGFEVITNAPRHLIEAEGIR